jgi:hypothetical protein
VRYDLLLVLLVPVPSVVAARIIPAINPAPSADDNWPQDYLRHGACRDARAQHTAADFQSLFGECFCLPVLVLGEVELDHGRRGHTGTRGDEALLQESRQIRFCRETLSAWLWPTLRGLLYGLSHFFLRELAWPPESCLPSTRPVFPGRRHLDSSSEPLMIEVNPPTA